MSASKRRSYREQAPPARRYVALILKQGRELVAKPVFSNGRLCVVGRSKHTVVGELSLVEGSQGSYGRVRAVERLGNPRSYRVLLRASMLNSGVLSVFSKEALAAAESSASLRLDVPRSDLGDLPTFTVDPKGAKDYDDAISAEQIGAGTVRVWVHIADVSAYVPQGSLLDREAYLRSTSVYLPGTVAPMLPKRLSGYLCSLVAGEDRLAVTVRMDIAESGVSNVSFERSLIRSNARLTYEQVDAIFTGKAAASEPWGEPLGAARQAASVLRAARGRSAVQLRINSPELEFSFNSQGDPVGSEVSVQTESHEMIEALMIAANEQVAKRLRAARSEALYRVHEPPERERVALLTQQLEALNVPSIPIPQGMTDEGTARYLGELSVLIEKHCLGRGLDHTVFSWLLLRSLKQARYSSEPLGHCGLGLRDYAHFTSPIRRYPDLVAHRRLVELIGAGERSVDPPLADIDSAAVYTSACERAAVKAERSARSVATAYLLGKQLRDGGAKQTFSGVVSGAMRAGVFVRLKDSGCEGFIPVRSLKGDLWELNETLTGIYGVRSGGTLSLGDELKVSVAHVDVPRGRIDLKLLSHPQASTVAKAQSRGGGGSRSGPARGGPKKKRGAKGKGRR